MGALAATNEKVNGVQIRFISFACASGWWILVGGLALALQPSTSQEV
jgi:hypothetical protein